MKSTTTAKQVK